MTDQQRMEKIRGRWAFDRETADTEATKSQGYMDINWLLNHLTAVERELIATKLQRDEFRRALEQRIGEHDAEILSKLGGA